MPFVPIIQATLLPDPTSNTFPYGVFVIDLSTGIDPAIVSRKLFFKKADESDYASPVAWMPYAGAGDTYSAPGILTTDVALNVVAYYYDVNGNILYSVGDMVLMNYFAFQKLIAQATRQAAKVDIKSDPGWMYNWTAVNALVIGSEVAANFNSVGDAQNCIDLYNGILNAPVNF